MLKKQRRSVKSRRDTIAKIRRSMTPEMCEKVVIKTDKGVSIKVSGRVAESARDLRPQNAQMTGVVTKTSSGEYVDSRLLQAFKSFESAREKQNKLRSRKIVIKEE